jgi:hypothetical protein
MQFDLAGHCLERQISLMVVDENLKMCFETVDVLRIRIECSGDIGCRAAKVMLMLQKIGVPLGVFGILRRVFDRLDQ